jgi:SAM-dependent methyltransferase
MADQERAPATALLSFVRANLPAPPLRVLEVGAGEGRLARALAAAGYDVLAIDPEPRGAGVHPASLHELDEAPGSFAAAVAITSLHHVEPLDESVARLAELLEPEGVLLVDEFDVGAFDERAAEWWLRQRRALGGEEQTTAHGLVADHRAHLHSLEQILVALEPHFRLGTPVYGTFLYRWNLDDALRHEEEVAIARAQIPAVGARLLAHRAPQA